MDLGSVQGSLEQIIPEQYAGFPIMLVAVLLLGLLALYSYKIFKITLTLGGAIVFGMIGNSMLTPIILGFMEKAPEGINLGIAVGFVCALIGGVLMNFFFKLALFISGAGAGWMVGATVVELVRGLFPTVEFLKGDLGALVISAFSALTLGVLSLFLFKFIYIVFTSLGGMIAAIVMVVTSIKPDPGIGVLSVAVVIGMIAGIIAAAGQSKSSSKNHHNERE